VPPEVEYRYVRKNGLLSFVCALLLSQSRTEYWMLRQVGTPCIVCCMCTIRYLLCLMFSINFEHRELYGVGFGQRRNDIICGEESLRDVVVTGTGLLEGTTGEYKYYLLCIIRSIKLICADKISFCTRNV